MPVSEQDHEHQADQAPEEREKTLKDLDVPEEEADDVKGGFEKWKFIQE